MSKTMLRKADVYAMQIIFPWNKKNQPEIPRWKGIIAKNENKTNEEKKNKQSRGSQGDMER